jgi:hypothetical protein
MDVHVFNIFFSQRLCYFIGYWGSDSCSSAGCQLVLIGQGLSLGKVSVACCLEHSTNLEDESCHLGYSAVKSGSRPTFQRWVLPPSSG